VFAVVGLRNETQLLIWVSPVPSLLMLLAFKAYINRKVNKSFFSCNISSPNCQSAEIFCYESDGKYLEQIFSELL
jgi:hypothetical protein